MLHRTMNGVAGGEPPKASIMTNTIIAWARSCLAELFSHFSVIGLPIAERIARRRHEGRRTRRQHRKSPCRYDSFLIVRLFRHRKSERGLCEYSVPWKRNDQEKRTLPLGHSLSLTTVIVSSGIAWSTFLPGSATRIAWSREEAQLETRSEGVDELTYLGSR